jgi:hypothetical protein
VSKHAAFAFNLVDPQSTARLLTTMEVIWTDRAPRRTIIGLEGVVRPASAKKSSSVRPKVMRVSTKSLRKGPGPGREISPIPPTMAGTVPSRGGATGGVGAAGGAGVAAGAAGTCASLPSGAGEDGAAGVDGVTVAGGGEGVSSAPVGGASGGMGDAVWARPSPTARIIKNRAIMGSKRRLTQDSMRQGGNGAPLPNRLLGKAESDQRVPQGKIPRPSPTPRVLTLPPCGVQRRSVVSETPPRVLQRQTTANR